MENLLTLLKACNSEVCFLRKCPHSAYILEGTVHIHSGVSYARWGFLKCSNMQGGRRGPRQGNHRTIPAPRLNPEKGKGGALNKESVKVNPAHRQRWRRVKIPCCTYGTVKGGIHVWPLEGTWSYSTVKERGRKTTKILVAVRLGIK